MKNSPQISHIRNRDGVVGRPTKVLITGVFPGSTFKNQLDTAKGLSKEKDANGNHLYDVTILVCKGNKKVKETATLHKREFPVHVDDVIIDGKEKSVGEIIDMVATAQKKVISLLHENRFVLDELKAEGFDIGLTFIMPAD